MAARVEKLITKGQELDHNLTRHEADENVEWKTNAILSEIGQNFFDKHLFALFNLMLSGLTTLMYVPTIVSVLKTTELSSNPMGSFVRYLSTLNHVVEWFKSPDKMMKSLKKVRSIHTKVNRLSKDETGQKMTQFDMVVTQWAFFGPVFIFPERIGLSEVNEEELKGLAHKMYLIGYVLGVSDEFNLCTGTLEEIKDYCRHIHHEIILPCLENASDLSQDMAEAMLMGSKFINPFIFINSYLAFVYETYQAEKWQDKIKDIPSLYTRFIHCGHVFLIQKLLIWKLTRWFMRPLVNHLLRLNLYLCNMQKGKIIKEQYHKFIERSVGKFWSLQTKHCKEVEHTVGKHWLKYVRDRKQDRRQELKRVLEIEAKFGHKWKQFVVQHKLERQNSEVVTKFGNKCQDHVLIQTRNKEEMASKFGTECKNFINSQKQGLIEMSNAECIEVGNTILKNRDPKLQQRWQNFVENHKQIRREKEIAARVHIHWRDFVESHRQMKNELQIVSKFGKKWQEIVKSHKQERHENELIQTAAQKWKAFVKAHQQGDSSSGIPRAENQIKKLKDDKIFLQQRKAVRQENATSFTENFITKPQSIHHHID